MAKQFSNDVTEITDRWVAKIDRLREQNKELLAENETLKVDMVNHFHKEHLHGDGPEIDRWKRQNKELLEACKAAIGYVEEDSSEYARWVFAQLKAAIEKAGK